MPERYHLVHRTSYEFAEWVPSCELEAQLRPRARAGLECVEHYVSVIPPAHGRETLSDRFGNPVERLVIRRPLRRLVVSAATLVTLVPGADGAGEALPDATDDAWPADDETRALCFDYAAPSLAGCGSSLAGVAALARQINRDMTYDASLTEVGRPVPALLRERRGICQDYARLAVATLRAHGIPARWVVGYVLPGTLRNPAPRGSYNWLHAWFSAFTADRGWVDFDATEPSGEAAGLLTLASGGDEAAVGPLRGKLAVEVSRQKLRVDITINRLG